MQNTLLGSVTTTVNDDGLATITFEHPSHNSLPGRLLAALTEAIRHCSDRDDVRIILLKSGGNRTFCAGASFDELAAISDHERGKEFFMGFARVINACRTSSKIIIGRVQGKAVGGGVGVAAAVDYCLATTHAAFRLSELAVGIGPFVVGPVIERKIGLAAMSGLALTPARWYSAEWGQEKGLYAEVFENADQLDKGVKRLVAELLSYSSEAMSALKQAFWAGTDHWDALLEERASISGHLVLSPAARAAISAFKGK